MLFTWGRNVEGELGNGSTKPCNELNVLNYKGFFPSSLACFDQKLFAALEEGKIAYWPSHNEFRNADNSVTREEELDNLKRQVKSRSKTPVNGVIRNIDRTQELPSSTQNGPRRTRLLL